MNPQKQITIADTTLRDGEQAPGCAMRPAVKRRIAAQLHRLGVDVIEAGFPASSSAEFEAVRSIAQTTGRDVDAPVIQAFGRCVPSDVDAALRAIARARRGRVHVFIAASDLHLKHKLHMTRDQALDHAVAAVRRARRDADAVQFSPEDSFRADRGYLRSLIRAVVEAGATVINLTDTVGYATPEEFGAFVSDMRRAVPDRRTPGRRASERAVTWSTHCHDDLGLAVANSLAAINAGATQVEVTVNGIGERAGNAALEEVVMALRTRAGVYGARTNIRTTEIARTSRIVSRLTASPVAANKSIVGANAFAHGSGIHQDGLLKNPETYEIMRPQDVGVPASSLPLTARSGRAALRHRLKEIGIRPTEEELGRLFTQFKHIADRRRIVTDADLRRIAVA